MHDKQALLAATACSQRRGSPLLPQTLWYQISGFLDYDNFQDDTEGVFVLKARNEPVPGMVGPGDARLSFSLCLIGNCFGCPAKYKCWSSHPTTSTSLPVGFADVIAPSWRSEVGRCTRLCCELFYTHSSRSLTSTRSCSFTPIVDWHGTADDSYRHQRFLDEIARIGASIAYFSARCRCSLAYTIHRLGQLQAARQNEAFDVVDRQRGIGYGVKEYSGVTVQVRRPSFQHLPVVLVEFDEPCNCGAGNCGQNGPRVFGRQELNELAWRLRCPLVQGKAGQAAERDVVESAFDALVTESHRLHKLTCLSPISVPQGFHADASLHLTPHGSERLQKSACCVL